MSGGEVGPQNDGSAIAGARIGEPTCRAQSIAEIRVTLREVRNDRERLAD